MNCHRKLRLMQLIEDLSILFRIRSGATAPRAGHVRTNSSCSYLVNAYLEKDGISLEAEVKRARFAEIAARSTVQVEEAF